MLSKRQQQRIEQDKCQPHQQILEYVNRMVHHYLGKKHCYKSQQHNNYGIFYRAVSLLIPVDRHKHVDHCCRRGDRRGPVAYKCLRIITVYRIERPGSLKVSVGNLTVAWKKHTLKRDLQSPEITMSL